MSQLLDRPFVQASVGYAKALAVTRGDASLTAAVFLAGLLLAKREEVGNSDGEIIQNWEDNLLWALDIAGLVLPEDAPNKAGDKMPVEGGLKKALGEAEGDLDTLIEGLLALVIPDPVTHNEHARLVMSFAGPYVIRARVKSVTGEVFAAAAFAAFEAGAFRRYAGLSSFFAANRLYLNALVSNRFDGFRSERKGRRSRSGLAKNLAAALRRGGNDLERFFAGVDIGLATGAAIVSAKATAYHEAGHAIVLSVLRPEVPVTRVSIKPGNGYLGVTCFDASSPHLDKRRREDFLVEVCALLAGRAAQLIKFGTDQIDTGASEDLKRATKRAWQSIACDGLDPEFGPIDISELPKEGCGTWLADRAQQRLQDVMKQAAQRTEDILTANWAKLEAVAITLLEREELNFEEFVASLTVRGLEGVPCTVMVESLPLERNVRFATEAASIETPEGAVRFALGDALVSGECGEMWPVSRGMFHALYEAADPVRFGSDGRYRKKVRRCPALPLREATRVDMLDGKGLLVGGAGDWIVDYGSGDLAIVSGVAFEKAYKVVGPSSD